MQLDFATFTPGLCDRLNGRLARLTRICYTFLMSQDAAIGCVVIAAALVLIIVLVIWSRKIIERIASRSGVSSAREIMRDMRRGPSDDR